MLHIVALQCYALQQVFCRKQSFVYLQSYLYSMGKIVNKQRIICDRIPGSRYIIKANDSKTRAGNELVAIKSVSGFQIRLDAN